MEFSERVKSVRAQLVLSQAELAELIGVAFASVNRWENGIRIPTKKKQRAFYNFCAKQGIYFPDVRVMDLEERK